jgi:hypothetical protein
MSPTQPLLEPLRLPPGADLRTGLQAALAARGARAAFVVAGIGSLRPARLRLAGAEAELTVDGDSEILTLSGSLSPDGWSPGSTAGPSRANTTRPPATLNWWRGASADPNRFVGGGAVAA